MDYFRLLNDEFRHLLNYGIAFSQSVLEDFPELYRLLATGMIQVQLNDEDSRKFAQAVRMARARYALSLGNQTLADTVFELYDVAHLHGNESGFFIGYVFPSLQNQRFKYIVNPSGMRNARGFDFAEAKFEGCAPFQGYDFQNYYVRFHKCSFKRELDFSNTRFRNWVKFEDSNLDTPYGFIGMKPFNNANFEGDYLHFKGGSLCTLSGIKLSKYTDLIIDDDVDVCPKKIRLVGDQTQFRNVRDEVFFIAKKQAERTGNISLLKRYEDNSKKFFFDYELLLEILVEIILVMQKRNCSYLLEDMRNDFIKDALGFKGYRALDQTRAGTSHTGKGSGELDIEISNEFGIPFTILEALRLKSVVKKDISKHVKKLLSNYDTSGHKTNFIIVYYEGKRFDGFCSKYKNFIQNNLNDNEHFQESYKLQSTSEIVFDKTDIKVLECKHGREGRAVSVIHCIVKIFNG